MLVSAITLLLLSGYLWHRREITFLLIVLSILPQYHFRYWLFTATGFSNHMVIYGDTLDSNIDPVNLYLDSLLLIFSLILFVYVRWIKVEKISRLVDYKVHQPRTYASLLLALLAYAFYFRWAGNVNEENFSTLLFSLIGGAFTYAGVYAKTRCKHLFVILCCGTTAVLIGFKSLILLLFVALLFDGQRYKPLKLIAYASAIIGLMLIAANLRGVDSLNLGIAVLNLIISHYDSWSFLVIAFQEINVNYVNNFLNWILSFIILIPGFSSLFEIQSYGHFLNIRYSGDWYERAAVLLAPGIIGELLSLGFWVPFVFLPFIVIAFDRVSKLLSKHSLPMHIAMLTSTIFLLEAPMSNLGQLVKTLVVILGLGWILGYRKRKILMPKMLMPNGSTP